MDRRLKQDFFAAGHEVVTVAEAGWAGKKNGELLRLAEERFDVLLSTDKGIPHQQNVSRLDLAVVLLRAKSNATKTWHRSWTRPTRSSHPSSPVPSFGYPRIASPPRLDVGQFTTNPYAAKRLCIHPHKMWCRLVCLSRDREALTPHIGPILCGILDADFGELAF